MRLPDVKNPFSDEVVLGGEGGEAALLSPSMSSCWRSYEKSMALLDVRLAFCEGRPARLVTIYSHCMPRFSQRVQIGFCLVHLTFAAAQGSQLSRNLGDRGFVDEVVLFCVPAGPVEDPDPDPEPLLLPFLGAVRDAISGAVEFLSHF